MEEQEPPSGNLVTNHEVDQYLFIESARPGTVDLRKGRSDEVVAHMLDMRDSGDHPSQISESSRLEQRRVAIPLRGEPRSDYRSEFRPNLEKLREVEEEEEVFVPRRPAVPPSILEQVEEEKEERGRRPEIREESQVTPIQPREESDRYAKLRQQEARSSREREDDAYARLREETRNDGREDDKYTRLRGDAQNDDDKYTRLRGEAQTDNAGGRVEDVPSQLSRRSAKSALGTGRDIASRFVAPAAPRNLFAEAVEKQVEELNRPAVPIIPAMPPMVFSDNKSRHSRTSRHSHTSRHSRQQRYSSPEDRFMGGRYDRYDSGGGGGGDEDRRREKSPASAVESSVSHPDRRRDRQYKQRRQDMDRRNRHELILELDKTGVKIVGNEETWELQHLLERHYANQHLIQRVATVKSCIKFGAFVVEKLVMLFVPKIPLKGWCEHLCAELDSGNHDQTLEQVSRKFWRKGPPNATMSLGLLIAGSCVMYCLGVRKSGDEKETAGGGGGGGGMFKGLGGMMSGLLGAFGKGGSPPPASRVNIQSTAASVPTSSGGEPRRRSKMPPPT